MMAMFPGHAFFPSSALYGNAMAGFIPAPSPSGVFLDLLLFWVDIQ